MRWGEPRRALLRDERGATMVEFALIALVFFIIVFGICELSLMLFQWKSAEKAVQLGARMAVVSNLLPGVPLSNTKANPGVAFGDPCGGVGGSACSQFATVSCTSASCGGSDFDYIVARMQEAVCGPLPNPLVPDPNCPLRPTHVTIQYEYVGLGFVGGPTAPAVTVTISRPFDFIIVDDLLALLAGGPVLAPMVTNVKSATLTGEDLGI